MYKIVIIFTVLIASNNARALELNSFQSLYDYILARTDKFTADQKIAEKNILKEKSLVKSVLPEVNFQANLSKATSNPANSSVDLMFSKGINDYFYNNAQQNRIDKSRDLEKTVNSRVGIQVFEQASRILNTLMIYRSRIKSNSDIISILKLFRAIDVKLKVYNQPDRNEIKRIEFLRQNFEIKLENLSIDYERALLQLCKLLLFEDCSKLTVGMKYKDIDPNGRILPKKYNVSANPSVRELSSLAAYHKEALKIADLDNYPYFFLGVGNTMQFTEEYSNRLYLTLGLRMELGTGAATKNEKLAIVKEIDSLSVERDKIAHEISQVLVSKTELLKKISKKVSKYKDSLGVEYKYIESLADQFFDGKVRLQDLKQDLERYADSSLAYGNVLHQYTDILIDVSVLHHDPKIVDSVFVTMD